ncbi:Dehydrocurvularin exporter [Lachnellula suecica]|uniref:Dehydrocurvularin exporter n=1 Tax=Lachnellula suecica TaxID=602035 RepID=A0A8T9CHF0_9HELO|nr:Dehydrocurvularin exporter [Lachnellula suecica]
MSEPTHEQNHQFETSKSADSAANEGHLKSSDSLHDPEKPVQIALDDDEPTYYTGFRLWAIIGTLYLTTLLAALDIGIVATAIPGITDSFHNVNDVGWYGGAIFLLVSTTSPMWGKLYKYLSARWIYLIAISLFLIGSIVAATATNSIALIIARAIQGMGASGALSGSVLMINYVAHPSQQPLFLGLWTTVYMISTIIGPLIGGAFTTHVTWRWCFWINLPVGGPVVAMVLIFFHVPKHVKYPVASWKEILINLDIPGFSVLVASLVCFTLALQKGGQTELWSDGSVIATLVMWVVLTIGFFVIEYFMGYQALVPLGLLKSRLAWTNTLYAMMVNVAEFQILFYLPIYFQSVHGQSAIASGVNSLPFMAFFGVGSILAGGVIAKTQVWQPFLLASGLVATAGAALMYTLEIDSSKGRYLGPEVLVGFGIGLGCQVPMMALQAFTPPEDVAVITSILIMANSISGEYFVTAAQSVFTNRLLDTLRVTAPHIPSFTILGTGATDIRRVFTGDDLAHVLDAYMVGTKAVFAFSIAGAAFTAVLALIVPFKKMPDPNAPKKVAEVDEKSSSEVVGV